MSNTNKSSHGIGAIRYQSDLRQLGGVLMVTGFAAVLQPLAGIDGGIGPNGTTASQGIPLSLLFGGLTIVVTGIASVMLGYLRVVHDWSPPKSVILASIIFTQTSWISYMSNMVNIGRVAKNAMGFIPMAYAPEQADFNFVGTMGIFGIISYGFTLIGTVAFFQFALYAYVSGSPETRNADYYRGRMGFYCSMLFLAGFAQLALGSYVAANFEGGSLSQGPIGVAMFLVQFPSISIIVGAVQLVNSTWGVLRYKNIAGMGNDQSNTYQYSVLFGWFLQFTLQFLVQFGYQAGGTANITTFTAMSLGMNLMPAYLDFKARTTPADLAKYYSMDGSVGTSDATSKIPVHEEPVEPYAFDPSTLSV